MKKEEDCISALFLILTSIFTCVPLKNTTFWKNKITKLLMATSSLVCIITNRIYMKWTSKWYIMICTYMIDSLDCKSIYKHATWNLEATIILTRLVSIDYFWKTILHSRVLSIPRICYHTIVFLALILYILGFSKEVL